MSAPTGDEAATAGPMSGAEFALPPSAPSPAPHDLPPPSFADPTSSVVQRSPVPTHGMSNLGGSSGLGLGPGMSETLAPTLPGHSSTPPHRQPSPAPPSAHLSMPGAGHPPRSPAPGHLSVPGGATPRPTASGTSTPGGGTAPSRTASGLTGGRGTSVDPREAAKEAAMQAAEMTSLKAELKRLRDENFELRRLADRFRKNEVELEYLRAASLTQHEEKVPIRLRQLEQENARLRRLNTSLEERLRTIESEEHRQRMLEHQRFFHQDFDSPVPTADTSSKSVGRSRGSAVQQSSHGADAGDDADAGLAVGSGGVPPNVVIGSKNVVVIKGGTGPCTNCKFKLSVQQRAHEGEQATLRSTIADLEAKLSAATQELGAIQQWVSHVVQTHQKYPTLAQRFPTTTLVSPGRAPAPNEFASPTPGSGAQATPRSYLDAQRVGATPSTQSTLGLAPGSPPRARQW